MTIRILTFGLALISFIFFVTTISIVFIIYFVGWLFFDYILWMNDKTEGAHIGTCNTHKGKVCYIKVRNSDYHHSVDDVVAIADYNEEGNLIGIEFPNGIPRKDQIVGETVKLDWMNPYDKRWNK